MSELDGDIAKSAKAVGGDAVILESEDDDVVGVAGFASTNVYGSGGYGSYQANGFTTGTSRPIKKHDSRYIVVKYLADDPPTASAAPK